MTEDDQPTLEVAPRGFHRFAHVIVYVNLAFALGLAFEAGAEHQRLSQVEIVEAKQEQRISEVQQEAVSTAELSGQISMLRDEMKRVRDRLDRFLDEGK